MIKIEIVIKEKAAGAVAILASMPPTEEPPTEAERSMAKVINDAIGRFLGLGSKLPGFKVAEVMDIDKASTEVLEAVKKSMQ